MSRKRILYLSFTCLLCFSLLFGNNSAKAQPGEYVPTATSTQSATPTATPDQYYDGFYEIELPISAVLVDHIVDQNYITYHTETFTWPFGYELIPDEHVYIGAYFLGLEQGNCAMNTYPGDGFTVGGSVMPLIDGDVLVSFSDTDPLINLVGENLGAAGHLSNYIRNEYAHQDGVDDGIIDPAWMDWLHFSKNVLYFAPSGGLPVEFGITMRSDCSGYIQVHSVRAVFWGEPAPFRDVEFLGAMGQGCGFMTNYYPEASTCYFQTDAYYNRKTLGIVLNLTGDPGSGGVQLVKNEYRNFDPSPDFVGDDVPSSLVMYAPGTYCFAMDYGGDTYQEICNYLETKYPFPFDYVIEIGDPLWPQGVVGELTLYYKSADGDTLISVEADWIVEKWCQMVGSICEEQYAPTYTPTITPTATMTETPTLTPTVSPSPTVTPTPTRTGTATITETPTQTNTNQPSDTPPPTNTQQPTTQPTYTQYPTYTQLPQSTYTQYPTYTQPAATGTSPATITGTAPAGVTQPAGTPTVFGGVVTWSPLFVTSTLPAAQSWECVGVPDGWGVVTPDPYWFAQCGGCASDPTGGSGGASNCASVQGVDIGGGESGSFGIPVMMVSDANCTQFGGWVVDLSLIGIGLIEFPGFVLCLKYISFGVLTVLDVAIDLDVIALVAGAAAILRIFFRS
ncbi:hypothetical protein ACFLYP_03830 [Chloroflexota bacterium]